ncbi:hypothetical protein BV22DRAFT_764335 [Leucogyrophana mollusca]|uniref:Uncharacterized protein n=1 Tax=Leucogyrophana mollusca TaxID=85980 RepID=A0ACB8B7T7_9AGAM|nr:hypothetical protein BV22DRAFT_764335 [Leucogyrophana mollusca]
MQTNDEAHLNEHRKGTELENDPGAYPFPVGVYKGKRLDSVPDGMRYWAVHPLRQAAIWPSLRLISNTRSTSSVPVNPRRGSCDLANTEARGLTKFRTAIDGGVRMFNGPTIVGSRELSTPGL